MTGLAEPPQRWEPETATPPVLETPAAAAIPNGVVKSIADTPATEPWYGSKDGFCAPVRQEGSWWGASALRWESEMDKVSFLKILKRIGLYIHVDGLGDQHLPLAVLAATFDTWETSRSLKPIEVYEQIRLFLGDVPGQSTFSDDYLDWIQSVLDGESYWPADAILEPYEIKRIGDRITRHRQKNAEREAIRQRRYEAGRALSAPELRRRVFERDGYCCRSCSSSELLAVDHIVAVINGGTDDVDNLQTLCRTCNSSKGRKQAAAWQRRAKKEGLS